MRSLLPLVSVLLMYASFVMLYFCDFTPHDPRSKEVASEKDLIGEWWFIPDYRLPGRAGDVPTNDTASNVRPTVQVGSLPVLFHDQLPTQRFVDLRQGNSSDHRPLPTTEFSIEMWSMYHVDRPVGALIAGRVHGSATVPWSVGFYDWKASIHASTGDVSSIELQKQFKPWSGFKERWFHLVANFSRDTVSLYVNGDFVDLKPRPPINIDWPSAETFEIAAYLQNEPYMELGNLVRAVRLWDQPLREDQIRSNFSEFCEQVEQGIVHPNRFHFTAPPSLHLADQTSVNLIWETDRPTTATLKWGATSDFEHSATFENSSRLHETTINNLEPNTTYFYRVLCQAGEQTIDSGLLSFQTAVESGRPFRFAIIGDTESRPHINYQLSKLIWDERPNFLINLGDLTDGGMEPHRYEWTHEYFAGMGALLGRLPAFPVPGNGEGDLYWYRHYHRLPEPEGFYQFNYGDIDFFMLDSNQRKTEFAPDGLQYQWLQAALAKSTAKWRIVCHHHATYTSEEDDYGDRWQQVSTLGDTDVQQLIPLYEQFHVDMVMFGHLHLYERSFPIKNGKVDLEQGTLHLLAGGAGGNLEDFGPTPAWFTAKTYRGHHYIICEVVGDSLIFRMYDSAGGLRDQWQMAAR
ncbi:MAG: metallophosphoesterase [Planctomycetaceae bacterium]|nr:metallophosphoesterase [Planctomycetaceae bacterium]